LVTETAPTSAEATERAAANEAAVLTADTPEVKAEAPEAEEQKQTAPIAEDGKEESPEDKLRREEIEAQAKVEAERLVTERAETERKAHETRAYTEGVERAYRTTEQAVQQYFATTQDPPEVQRARIVATLTQLKGQFATAFSNEYHRAARETLPEAEREAYDRESANWQSVADAVRYFKTRVESQFPDEKKLAARIATERRKAVDEYKASIGALGGSGATTSNNTANGTKLYSDMTPEERAPLTDEQRDRLVDEERRARQRG